MSRLGRASVASPRYAHAGCESRTSGNVGRVPLVPAVDDAGCGAALDPVPILARPLPRGASRLIGSGEGMCAPSGLGSGDDRDRAHVAYGSVRTHCADRITLDYGTLRNLLEESSRSL